MFDVIRYKLTPFGSFARRECQKIQKLIKSSHLPNDVKNFNEIFIKNVSYDNIKSHKNSRFYPLSRIQSFGNTTGGVKLTFPQYF